jgi:hypothetical protein
MMRFAKLNLNRLIFNYMCDSIRLKNGEDIGSVRKFQEHFQVDATKFGFDGDERFLDTCLCQIDLDKFFKENPEHKFISECGDWWEQ